MSISGFLVVEEGMLRHGMINTSLRNKTARLRVIGSTFKSEPVSTVLAARCERGARAKVPGQLRRNATEMI